MNLDRPAADERIVAIGLLTKRDLRLLGPAFDRAWPVGDALQFEGLLRAIDAADLALARGSGRAGNRRP
jgi:hypothetical protein